MIYAVYKILHSNIYGFGISIFIFGKHCRKWNVVTIKVYLVMVLIFEFLPPL